MSHSPFKFLGLNAQFQLPFSYNYKLRRGERESMKQQNPNRRSNVFRSLAAMVDGGSGDEAAKSPASIFWYIFHGLCCLISLVLGFRFSRLVFFLLLSPTFKTVPFLASMNRTLYSGSRVVVGRHGIRIRPWLHPDPNEVMRAQGILNRVQKEQRVLYGVEHPRPLIVVTPTYVRTFQALHLTGVMHSLMNAPYDVVWIVVEAGGVTNETADLIRESSTRMRIIHIGFDERMPVTWADRSRVEDLMRVHALRLVRDRKLDGIVMFADDSNVHSLELFGEVQRVNWFGAISVGILVHSGNPDAPSQMEKPENEKGSLPIQGPICNSSRSFVGWHIFNMRSHAERSAVFIGDMGTVLPKEMEWAGFVLNSRLLWRDGVDKPEWVKGLASLEDESVESPLSMLKNPSVVEPLGNCGRKVLLWWLRVEARADSKFPPRWVINTPLEITVPAKHTPWPDASPELPSDVNVTTVEPQVLGEHIGKQPPKAQSRTKSSHKKKREAKLSETLISSRHLGDNLIYGDIQTPKILQGAA